MDERWGHADPGPWFEDEGLRKRWRAATDAVVAALLAEHDADRFLVVVARAATDLLQADLATIAVPWIADQSLRLRVAVGHRAQDLQHAIFPFEESLSGHVLRTGETVRVADVRTSGHAYQPVVELGDMGPVVMAPLVARGVAFATLLVGRRSGGEPFGDADLEALASFADHAALAVEFDQARQELGRLAVVEERERIERDLHDTVIQHLFAIGLDLQSVAAASTPDVATRIEDAVGRLNDLMTEIRSTVLEQPPPSPSSTTPSS